MIGVQALTLMVRKIHPGVETNLNILQAYYSQNIGSPCIEYVLCSSALRLALAKGLHRHAVPSRNLSQHEINQRNCIFWGAYCLEKQIVCQSGRPSVCALSTWT